MSLDDIVGKFLITSAVAGAKPNMEFLASLETYAKYNKVEKIYILPMRGVEPEDELDPYFSNSHYEVVTGRKKLNNNIQIETFNVQSSQIDPVTGLARFAQDDKSTIFASPKQRMKVIPNSNIDLPKVIMTTGACTKPYYTESRIGQIAKKDHIYGAIVVETEGRKWYHYRQLQAQTNGVFYDLGAKYCGRRKPLQVRPEALVLGDWHTGDTDKLVKAEAYKMIGEYKPRVVVLHDMFNGHSINHHEEGRLVDKYKTSREHGLSLDKELKAVYKQIQEFATKFPKTQFVVVKSNHDEFLERYLNETRFIKEPQNALTGAKLLATYMEDKDPLVAAMNMYGSVPDNVRFLKRDEDYKVKGWQLGNHGDCTVNGARASIRAIEFSNGKSIVGHIHTPQVFRNIYCVGTSTPLRLPYTKGFTGWMNTHCFLYDNSRPQMVNIVNGKHKC